MSAQTARSKRVAETAISRFNRAYLGLKEHSRFSRKMLCCHCGQHFYDHGRLMPLLCPWCGQGFFQEADPTARTRKGPEERAIEREMREEAEREAIKLEILDALLDAGVDRAVAFTAVYKI